MPAVILRTTVPSFASPEEHLAAVSSTPSSFADIPPVLRHKEDNVRVKLEPPIEGFTESDAANGTLYVIDTALVFMSSTGRGFEIAYPSITLHAISRGENGPSIYCQLDVGYSDTVTEDYIQNEQGATAVALQESIEDAQEEVEEEEEDTELQELTIVPVDAQSLEKIFEALSLCASLHPDPADGDEDDDKDEAYINGVEHHSSFETFTGDETQELSQVGRAALAHLESIIYDPHDHLASDVNGVDGDNDGDEEDEVDDLDREFEKIAIQPKSDNSRFADGA